MFKEELQDLICESPQMLIIDSLLREETYAAHPVSLTGCRDCLKTTARNGIWSTPHPPAFCGADRAWRQGRRGRRHGLSNVFHER